MNATVARLAFRALTGRRRGLLLVLLPVLLIALAIVIRALAGQGSGYEVVSDLGFTLGVPLVSLLAANAVLGPEIDDGSIVYLLAKPVNRYVVALSKYAVAAGAAVLVGALPLLAMGLIIDSSDPERALAWTGGGAVAALAYSAVFLALSAAVRFAVVVGLLFVLLWEGLLGGLFAGIRWVSIGDWGREIASGLSSRVSAPGTGAAYAWIALVLVTVAAVALAGDRLRSFSLRGGD